MYDNVQQNAPHISNIYIEKANIFEFFQGLQLYPTDLMPYLI